MVKTAQELCEERKKRILDAATLKVPDRVPTFPSFGTFAEKYYGITVKEAFTNMKKWQELNEKLLLEFEPDMFFPPIQYFDIASAEIAGSRYINWPGHNLPDTVAYQYVESDYMKADEYDLFLQDTGDYLFRKYLPRLYSNLDGLKNIPPMLGLGTYGGIFNTFSNPGVLEALETIIKSVKQNNQSMIETFAFVTRLEELGFPNILTPGPGLPPFDFISDYLRGLRGSTLDMFQRPEKLLAAEQKILDYTIESIKSFIKNVHKPLYFLAIHRGSDEFMSSKQFEKFYWPYFKPILLTIIDAGMIPVVLWEGNYESRFEYLAELPKGKTVALFDKTDIFKAKKVLGDRMCIAGGMQLSMLQTGTPDEVARFTKRLIDEVGEGGGFIMAANTMLDYADPALLKVFFKTTRECGVYR